VSDKMAEQLAEKIVGAVKKAGIREDILEVLTSAIENNVREASVQQLLVCTGLALAERDRVWVQHLSQEWAPKSGLRTATTPADVEREIRNWHAARISETRIAAYTEGYDACFPLAVTQGIKLGWGACEAGKNLEETLKAGEKLKPR
jgi:hypothetical protein